jgi:SAM-dependent methyltransferase
MSEPPLIPEACLGPYYRVEPFETLESFRTWSHRNTWIHAPERASQIVSHALAHGVSGPWVGELPPSRVQCSGPNFRETLLADGLNPRQRAVLDLLTTLPVAADSAHAAIYATEGVTDFAKQLAARFPKFIGSEYAPTEAERQRIAPVPHQDLACLTFTDASFDVAISNDVFEHLPDLPAALQELARVLKPGGTLLATFPFLPFHAESLIRARRRADGVTEKLMADERHGNPMDPDGSLVFQVPGWDIVSMAKDAGFRQCAVVLMTSVLAAITGAENCCIFLFVART